MCPNYTINVSQIPSHTHWPAERVVFWDASYSNSFSYNGLNWSGSDLCFGAKTSVPVGYTGGGKSHSNMQPYATLYYWRRTA